MLLSFSVLGPVTASRASEPIAIPGRKPNALLARFLLGRNHPLVIDDLIEALWDEPPPTANKMVHVFVSRLRRALGPAGSRLVTSRDGYLFRVEPDELDLDRFEGLIAPVRRPDSADRPELVARTLREALSLWTGPPLDDVLESEFLRREAVLLEDLRLSAVEDCVHAELALGRHFELAPELERLVLEHPRRERLLEALMVALYRCGRQADALDAYRQMCRRLDTELGIEPGGELKRIERAILEQDTDLDLPASDRRRVSGERRPTNLAAEATRLIGRGREVAEAAELLRRETRLLTLTGPPGTGKTRLALGVARALLPEYRDGVFVAELAEVRDPALILPSIARPLGVKETAALQPGLEAHLRDRRLLLVLDNFEQLVPAAALLSELLAAAPQLKLLVTSREPLRVGAEHEYPVPALPLPDSLDTLESVSESAAVQLFVERARAVQPSFELTEENSRTVAAICLRLDGLPLALELAAARIKLLAPKQLLERLERPLELLRSRRSDLPPRHRALEATFDWSYEFLSREEKQLFSKLAVFTGPFFLDDVYAIQDEEDLDSRSSLLDSVSSLVDKGLLNIRTESSESFFWMLGTIRDYARARLVEAGEEQEIRRRHARHFLEFAEEVRPALSGAEQADWLERLELERDNFRAALSWADEAGEAELQLRLATALGRFWEIRGHLSEARAALELALEKDEAQPPGLRAEAFRIMTGVARLQGDFSQAEPYAREQVRIFRSLGDRSSAGRALNDLALAVAGQGRHGDAAKHFDEAISVFADLGDLNGEAMTITNLTHLLLIQREYEAVVERTEDGLALFRELGDKLGIAVCLVNQALAALCLDRPERAVDPLAECLRVSRELGWKEGITYALEGAAALMVWEEELADAARLLGAATRVRTDAGYVLDAFAEELHRRTEATLESRLGRPAMRVLMEAGGNLSLSSAVELAVARCDEATAKIASTSGT